MRRLLLAALLVLSLAACGAEDDPEPIPVEPFGGDPQAPQIGVHEALQREGEEVVVVAFFVEGDGEAQACDSLAQPDPPVCADPSMPVQNVDLAALDDLEEEDGLRWTTQKVAVKGVVDEGVFYGVRDDDGDY